MVNGSNTTTTTTTTMTTIGPPTTAPPGPSGTVNVDLGTSCHQFSLIENLSQLATAKSNF